MCDCEGILPIADASPLIPVVPANCLPVTCKIAPDILAPCKALTGGTITFSATLTTREVAETISNGERAALCTGQLYGQSAGLRGCKRQPGDSRIWGDQQQVADIKVQLREQAAPARNAEMVADVRAGQSA